MNLAVKIPEIFAAMANQRARKRRPGFFGDFNGTGNEKLVVRMHEQTSDIWAASAKLGPTGIHHPMLKFWGRVAPGGIETYASRLCTAFLFVGSFGSFSPLRR